MSPSDDRHVSRRTLLRASGATLATVAAAAGGGCSGLPPLGTAIRYGSVDVPAATDPAYRNWLPAPSALPGGDGGDDEAAEEVLVYTPPPADTPAWTRANIARALIISVADYVGVDIDGVDVAVATAFGEDQSGAAALLGEVDPAAVRDTVATTSYEPVESDADYELYERTDMERAVGVRRDGLVFADGPRGRETIDTIVAASRGEVPRLHERDANFETLTDSAGLRRWAWLWPGGVSSAGGNNIREDTVGWATSFAHGDDTGYLVQTWVFPESYDLTAGKVKTALKAESRAGLPGARDATAVDVSVDGRVATIEMQAPPSEFAGSTETPFLTPFVTWSETYDAGAEQLTIHHDAGDPVRTDWLRIAGVGEGETVVEDRGLGDRLTAGDSLTVSTAGVEQGTTVRLVYRAPDEDRSTALFTYELP